MCGIGGFTWSDDELLAEMLRAIDHRGPDGRGTFDDGSVSLCHTRLSIIDLSPAAAQPMTDGDGRYSISYNGEIYNFQELRRELLTLGYVFTSESDTEALLLGFAQWGPEVFTRCNGMWAAAVYDSSLGKLYLARDRLGQKPLYYARSSKGWAFCSELTGVLPTLDDPRVDPSAVDLLLSSQFIPSPFSIIDGVLKLEPGHYLVVDVKSGSLHRNRYYQPPRYAPTSSRSHLVDECRALLRDSVSCRTVADVTVGAFLSGGVDSTAIAGYLSQVKDVREVRTCSVGFDLPVLDESEYAEMASQRFGTTHVSRRFRVSETESHLAAAMPAYDEPVLDPSSLPTFLLCQEARRSMKVALSGDGGDELFGGYDSRQAVVRYARLLRIPRTLRRALHRLVRTPPFNWISRLRSFREALRVSLYAPEDFFGEIGASWMYRPPAFKAWAQERLQELIPISAGNLVEAVLKFDLHYNRLGDNYCAKVDRMSMHHGLEVRSPFLDYRLVEFASRIPVKWKITSAKTKILLREAVSDVVPQEILKRKKQGFAAPVGAWADDNREILVTALEVLHSDGVLSVEWVDYYTKIALDGTDWRHREYRKRLALLWSWYEAQPFSNCPPKTHDKHSNADAS